MNSLPNLNGSIACVTGASGFIGGILADALADLGCEVRILARPSSDLQWIDRKRVRVFTGDLTGEIPEDWIKGAHYVFHCAGLTKAKTRADFFRGNAEACENLFALCSRHADNLKKIVHLSSLAAVGPAEPEFSVDETTPCQPVTHYGQSKLKGEQIALRWADTLPIVILRPPIVYGPREKNFFTFIQSLAKGWNIQIGRASKRFSMIHVADLTRAMILAAQAPVDQDRVWFITDGGAHSWDDIASTALKNLNRSARKITIPESALICIAILTEALYLFRKDAPLLDRQRMIDVRQSCWVASPNKFFKQFAFSPQYPLESGMLHAISWYRDNHWL